ncbi:hypothetical protein PSHT_11297, partial [Puccinia striiformis]
MPIIKLSPASIKRYCAGTPDSPQVLVCPACPGESHDPLDCVDYIRLRCPMISPEGSVMGTIDKDLLGKKDKTHNALQRIQNGFYDKPEYKDWRPRDMGKIWMILLLIPNLLTLNPKINHLKNLVLQPFLLK